MKNDLALLTHYHEYTTEHNVSPTNSEIGEMMGVSAQYVNTIIHGLSEKNILHRTPKKRRSVSWYSEKGLSAPSRFVIGRD